MLLLDEFQISGIIYNISNSYKINTWMPSCTRSRHSFRHFAYYMCSFVKYAQLFLKLNLLLIPNADILYDTHQLHKHKQRIFYYLIFQHPMRQASFFCPQPFYVSSRQPGTAIANSCWNAGRRALSVLTLRANFTQRCSSPSTSISTCRTLAITLALRLYSLRWALRFKFPSPER